MRKSNKAHKPIEVIDRRKFLQGIGAAAAAGTVTGAGLGPVEALAFQSGDRRRDDSDRRGDDSDPNSFDRIFNDLRPFAEPSSAVTRALIELGKKGGLMDAKDPLEVGPILLITDPANSANNPDNTAHTAGVTFVGQFLDHDMTFDAASRLGVPTDPEDSANTRTPSLDLDSVYGRGPSADRQYYMDNDRNKLRVESGGLFEDLPRSRDGTAIIADPRNDENMMISGLQAAFFLFHNRVVDLLRERRDDDRGFRNRPELENARDLEALDDRRDGDRREDVFDEARKLVTWHYHWIILHEFLPAIIGQNVVNDILLRGARFYTPRQGSQRMPVEFQGACYRFGHTLVRPSYRANLAGDNGAAFFGMIFDPAGEGQADPVDLRGGARASRRFIGWQTFFNFGGDQAANVRPNKIIDTRISTPLFNLPLGAIASGDPPTSLPQRNLLRHLTWSLPSGQSIAEEMRIPALNSSQFPELRQFGVGLERSTPLWYYTLREGQLAGGLTLVGVGARIVGEVIIELIRLDPNSFLAQNPRWQPTLPSRQPGTFGMVDLLTFARVDPASRKQ
jgi:hypothetical protein